MTKAEARAFYNEWKYYEIIDSNGKLCHGQYLTEQMVENMRARGFRLRLQRDHDAQFI